ncbi:MAG TPA: hypothetical protein VFR67_26970 [Pilimelia sp.]|nr:hypothetical protein [Pilimelia sp.]
MTDEDSVIGRVRPHGLDPETVTAYEVAQGLLNQVIGAYSARLHEQRDSPEAVAALRAEQARYAAMSRELRPGDRQRVEEVTRECAAILRDLRGEDRSR